MTVSDVVDPCPVTTVLGPRELEDGRLVDAHGHTWISPVPGSAPGGPLLDDEAAVSAELGAFAAAGGQAVIDCQPPGCGRDPRRQMSIARATGVAIIASTGFHLRRYYPVDAWAWTADAETLTEFFVSELVSGMLTERGERLSARAGTVKAAHAGALDSDGRRMLRAAAVAAARGGAVLVIHTERGRRVEELAHELLALGTAPEQIMLCHVDKRPDLGLHRALAQAGFLLEYDTFVRAQYAPDENAWPLLEGMFANGHETSIACGLDLADRSMWRFGGHPVGMLGLSEIVVAGLRARGATADQVRLVTGGNASARLRRAAARKQSI